MVSAYLTPDVNTLRNANSVSTQWYLSCQPRTVLWTGKVNGSPARGARSIPYDTGDINPQLAIDGWTWTSNDLVEEMPVYVETAYGVYRTRLKDDIGAAEVSGTMVVGQNNIPWADDQDLTITFDYPFWNKMPRVATNGVFFKDYSDTWANQTTLPPPVCVLGPDWADFLVAGSAYITWNLTDSYCIAPGATLSSYALQCMPMDGVTITGGASSTGSLTFTKAGYYWLKAQVTDSNGKSSYTRALYRVYDSTHLPIGINEFSSNNTIDQSGSTAQFRVNDTYADEDTLPDEARLMVFSKDYVNGSLNPQGGWLTQTMNKWQGYLVGSSIKRVPGASEVSFNAESITLLMNRTDMNSLVMQYDTTPTGWEDYAAGGITVYQALHYLWAWHSNLFHINSVYLPILDTNRRKYVEDFQYGSLLAMAKTFCCEHSNLCVIGCNDQGVIHVEIDAQIDPTGTAAGFALTDKDWIGDLTIEHNPIKQYSYIETSGLSFFGGDATPYYSRSGEVPDDRGQGEYNVEQLIVTSQANCNTICGRVMAKVNNPYPRVSMNLTPAMANSLAFMTVPQLWHEITINPIDTVRGFDWSAGKDLVVREINTTYKVGIVEKSVVFEPYNDGPIGIDGVYPTDEDIQDTDDDTPPPVLPPYVPPIPPEPSAPMQYAVLGDASTGVWWTNDYCATWTQRNTGLPNLALYPLTQVMWKRGWQTLQGTSDPESCILLACGLGWVYVSYDAGKTWVNRTPDTTAQPTLFDTTYWVIGGDAPLPTVPTINFKQVDCPNIANNTFYVLTEWQNATSDWRGWLCSTSDMGLTWTTDPVGAPGAASTPWSPGDPIYATGYYGLANTNANITGAVSSTGSITGAPDGNGLLVTFNNYSGGNQAWDWKVEVDMGGDITYTLGDTSIAITAKGILGDEGNSIFLNFNRVDISEDGTNWVQQSNGPGFGTAAYTTGTITLLNHTAGHKFRYVSYEGSMIMRPSGAPGYLQHSGLIDAVAVLDADSYDPPVMQTRPLGMAVDFETGHRVYVTEWEGANVTVDSYGMVVGDPADIFTTMYAATEAQVDAKTRYLFPRVVYQPTVADYGDKVYVFGTDSLGNGYVAESTDMAANFTDRSGGLTASLAGDRVTSLLAKGDGAGQLLYFYAFGDGKVYAENGSWVWDAGNATPVNPRPLATSVGYNTDLTLLLSESADVEVANNPYTSYTDKTNGSSGSESCEWVL